MRNNEEFKGVIISLFRIVKITIGIGVFLALGNIFFHNFIADKNGLWFFLNEYLKISEFLSKVFFALLSSFYIALFLVLPLVIINRLDEKYRFEKRDKIVVNFLDNIMILYFPFFLIEFIYFGYKITSLNLF